MCLCTPHSGIHNYFEDNKAHTPEECDEQYKHVIAEYNCNKRATGGHTSFVEVAEHAARLSEETKQFTIAVVVGDGAITDSHVSKTVAAVRKAAHSRVGFVFVGVGRPSNPSRHWAFMKELDDMKGRPFDNWQSIYMADYTDEERIALDAVAEIVNQVKGSLK